MVTSLTVKAKPFEEWTVGETFITKKHTIFEEDVTSYVNLTGYRAENLFGDMTFSHQVRNGKRLVPGLMTVSIADGLIVGSGILEGYAVGLVGLTSMKAKAPVYAGDTLHVEIKVTNVRELKSKKDRGIVTSFQEVKNQDGIIVLEYEVSRMLLKNKQSSKI